VSDTERRTRSRLGRRESPGRKLGGAAPTRSPRRPAARPNTGLGPPGRLFEIAPRRGVDRVLRLAAQTFLLAMDEGLEVGVAALAAKDLEPESHPRRLVLVEDAERILAERRARERRQPVLLPHASDQTFDVVSPGAILERVRGRMLAHELAQILEGRRSGARHGRLARADEAGRDLLAYAAAEDELEDGQVTKAALIAQPADETFEDVGEHVIADGTRLVLAGVRARRRFRRGELDPCARLGARTDRHRASRRTARAGEVGDAAAEHGEEVGLKRSHLPQPREVLEDREEGLLDGVLGIDAASRQAS